MPNLSSLVDTAFSRRAFVTGCAAAAAGVATGCDHPVPDLGITPTAAVPEADVLNFALNLEYLEAEFYLRAATGSGLSAADAGTGAGAVVGGRQVPFATAADTQYANEIAQQELNHVRFLRSVLGSAAVARPALDFTNGFAALGTAAGVSLTPFDPFIDTNRFLLGAFVFEDVGVTAYRGAVPLLTKANLMAATGLLAIEAYHAAEIRTRIYSNAIAGSDNTYLTAANKISVLRASIGGGAETQIGAGSDGSSTVAANGLAALDTTNAIGFSRNTNQVLHIVYGAASSNLGNGLFFPNGFNGNIKTSTS